MGWIRIIAVILLFGCASQKKTPEYYFGLAKHHKAEGDLIVAGRFLTKAIEKNPSYIDAYMERAGIWLSQDSFERAIQDYTKIIELRPARNNADIYYTRGNAYYSSLQDTLACRDFRRACDLNYTRACDAIRKYCKK